MAGMGNFLAGFMQAFGQGMLQKKQQEKADEFKKLQLKKFKADLDLAEKQQGFREQLGQMMLGTPGSPMPPAELGGGPAQPMQPGKSLNEILATGPGQYAYMNAGYPSPAKDIGLAQQRLLFEKVLSQLPGAGGGGLPGQIVSAQGAGAGVPIGGGRQIDPLSLLQATAGQDLSKLSEDIVSQKMRTPLSPSDLTKFQNAKGEFPTAGMTPYDLQRGGYKPVGDKLTIEQAGKAQSIEFAMNSLNGAIDLIAPGGIIDKSVVAQFALPEKMQWGAAREATQLINEAIRTKVLINSGVTARDDEVQAVVAGYKPNAMDLTQPGLAERKMQRLKDFMEGTLDYATLPQSLRARIKAKQKKDKTKPSLKLGSPKMPAGVDPALIEFMTPEERALFNQ